MSVESKFSSLLYNARKEHGYTQSMVAEAVSISVRWYQDIELGKSLPSAIIMLRLILLLNINIESLREDIELNIQIHS